MSSASSSAISSSLTPMLFTTSRRWSLAALLVLASLFYVLLHQSSLSPQTATSYLPRFRPSSSKTGSCATDLTLLQELDLVRPEQTDVKYAQIRLTHSPTGASRKENAPVQPIDLDFPELRTVPRSAWQDATSTTPHGKSYEDIPYTQGSIALPRLSKKHPDASHILFGVATTVERLNDSLTAFSHWASGNGARIHAVVKPADGVQETIQRAKAMDLQLEISESSDKMDDRYFSHIELFQKLKRPGTQWMAFIDDDTFFLSMSALIRMLDRYDASMPHYVGGLSENSDQVASWGLWAYGGAGVFLSTPLMDKLSEVYDECYAIGFTADWRISQCIYQHSTTKLSWEQRLHQMDLAVDQSGFYESGRQLPLSIHHWKSWIHLDVVAMTAIKNICGVECVLMRYRLRDGWILTNGFSIVHYSNDWSGEDATIERTWEAWDSAHEKNPGTNFLHSLGPLRPKDEKKQSYHLKAASTEGGVLRQFYTSHFNVDPHAIIEVCWQPS